MELIFILIVQAIAMALAVWGKTKKGRN